MLRKEAVDGQELLRLEGIEKSFGDTPVLRGIGLTVMAGEFITLLGSSGCGKTTTLRIIAGLEKADAGRVFLSGEDVTDLAPNKRDVNMVFQNYALFPHMNVESNIGYSLRLKGRPKDEIRGTVAEALDLVQLGGYGKRLPGELSGGQRQRVAVARALVNRPKVLLLDEPLGALDLRLRRQMQTELKRLQRQLNITFIYITHDQEEALTMSDRIAVMREGRFEQIGSATEIYDRPKTSYVAQFVGNANILRGRAGVVSGNQNLTMDNKSGETDKAGKIRETDGAGEIITFERPDGWAWVKNNGEPIAPGQELTLAVRSEYLILEPVLPGNGGSREEGLEAQVTEKSFAGGQLRISAALEDRTEICASRQGIDSLLEAGQRVRANWAKPGQAVIVDRANPAKPGQAVIADRENQI
ncbi:spermidine/putrescine ABC transporter ATP-binding subunit [Treponema primitia ZAS-2]|uniref:Spermidine/putrescine ABC transporter ATP-binding subunit n=1 Tax=Treponema primitia (strain ATCC BAA-887 / DSM 12427 / ZAS-2) TaxID=545694 RepID=F5YQ32_TREPZ|nr:ABC transporter ATP-binding protein [Treponema primitia]AEF86934.1 spermidine/putrescine ABC transporter ATP-binding subunit [Treponema primitia ZAS-2]